MTRLHTEASLGTVRETLRRAKEHTVTNDPDNERVKHDLALLQELIDSSFDDVAALIELDEARADELRSAATELENENENSIMNKDAVQWLRKRAGKLWPAPAQVDAMYNLIREVVLSEEGANEDLIREDEIKQLAVGLMRSGRIQMVTQND